MLAALEGRDGQAKLWGTLRLLQATIGAPFRLGYGPTPHSEGIRLEQGLVLGHAAREVQDVRLPDGDGPSSFDGDAHPQRAETTPHTHRVIVTQNAVGLLGPSGPMPSAWTQYVLQLPSTQAARSRSAFLAFLNLLQRRQLAFLFRAWSDAQAITALDVRGGGLSAHPVADRLQAIAGVAHAGLASVDSLPPAFKQAFASTLSRRVRSPMALQGMLAAFLEVPVRIEEFCVRWLDIPRDQQTRLATQFATLGEGAVAGEQTCDAQTMFEVVIGPLTLDRYETLLPGGGTRQQVQDLLSLYCGPEWHWQLRLVLKSTEVPPCQLGGDGARIGWSSWIGLQPAGHDPGDFWDHIEPPLRGRTPAESHGECAPMP